jgi:hypothetical protein
MGGLGGAGGVGGAGGAGGVGGAGGAGGSPTIDEPSGTSLLVQIVDSTGAPLPNAAVTFKSDVLPADGAGRILFEDLSPGRFVARVEAYGFAPASVAVELPPGAHAGAQAVLLPLGPPIVFDAEVGATLDQGAARVTIPPNALIDENGQPITGMVEASVLPLDPTASSLASFPGPLEGIGAQNGEIVGLDSVLMAEISLWKDGNRLNLAPGVTAELELALPDAIAAELNAGDTIPAWWLDLDAGYWKEEGTGVIAPSSSDPSKLAWFADVGHFTWWNCDRPWTEKNCFDVSVVDVNGAAAPGLTLQTYGVSYVGALTTTATTSDGHACVDIKLGEDASLLIGATYAPLTSPIAIKGSGPAGSCTGQGAPCTPLAVVVPAPHICAPGAAQPCPYTGPPGTEGAGLCKAGKNYCDETGTHWIGCEGEVTPGSEACTSIFDEDCDGQANEEGQGCSCVPGALSTCYTGPPGTLGVGLCKAGQQACKTDGLGHAPCVGDIVPEQETCATPDDDNCDGSTDCGGVHVWSQSFGDASAQVSRSVAVDSAGNVVVTGYFQGTTDFGSGPLISAGTLDIFVAKFDASGKPLWSKRFGDADNQEGLAVAVDGAGNVFATGGFFGSVNFGGQTLTSIGKNDIFLVKLDASGQHVWSQSFGDGSTQYASGVAVDSAGNVLLTGTMTGLVDFGQFVTANGIDAFIAKFNSAGQHQWSKSFGQVNTMSHGLGIAVDGAGSSVIIGNFNGAADFGGGTLTSAGGWDIFVAKFNALGQHVYSKRYGDATDGFWNVAIAVDGAGNALMTGDFGGTVDFGGGPLTSAGNTDMFLAKLDPAGQLVFGEQFGDAGFQGGTGIAATGAGDILVTGGFTGTLDFGGDPLGNAGNFLARFDAMGQHIYSRQFGEPSSVLCNGLAVDSAGSSLITGHFGGDASLGGPVLAGAGSHDAFLVKFTP